MKLSNSEKIAIVSMLVTILIAAIKQEFNREISIIIVSVIVTIAFAYFTYLIIKTYKQKKSLSNSAVVAESAKYIKYLNNLANANDKRLIKLSNVNSFRSAEKIYKKINKFTKGKVVKTDENNDKLNKLLQELKKYQFTNINKKAKTQNKKHIKTTKQIDRNTSQIVSARIIKCILELDRVLLQIEQYQLKIKLGKFIIKYSNNDFEILKAYIDFVGWTNFLLGKNKEGRNAIAQAILMIDNKIGKETNIPSDMNEKDYYEYKFLKVRALRHLSTTHYSYKSNDYIEDEFDESYKIMKEVNFKNYYVNSSRYLNMLIGIENNYYLYKFYIHQEMVKKNQISDFDYKTVMDIINEYIQKIKDMPLQEQDRHRLIKLYVFKNQLLKEFSDEKNSINERNEFKEDLKNIETIFNKNIYLDDALEVFVNEKIQDLYDDVRDIISK